MTKQLLVLVRMECDDEEVSAAWIRDKIVELVEAMNFARVLGTTIAKVDVPPTRKKATARQREIYEWIARYIERQGYPPTIREICAGHGIVSPNGVVTHLKALARRGWLSHGKGDARAIRLLDQPVVLSPLPTRSDSP